MSHEIYINLRGKASMAYVGDEPWHGLGQQLTKGAPLNVWAKEAGLDYTIQDTPVMWKTPDGQLHVTKSKKVLYRSDTNEQLGLVGSKYRVVQPAEVLEFFRNLVQDNGFELETAGVLFNGAQYWALANTGLDATIGKKGKNGDAIKGYLLLATGCDGKLATTAQFTSVRVVCNNTLTAAIRGQNVKDNSQVKVNHRSQFDISKVQGELGLTAVWNDFIEGANTLADIHVKDDAALDFVISLVGDPEKDPQQQTDKAKAVATVWQLYKGKGRGSELKSAEGTAWGLVNATTEYLDHFAGNNQDNRLRMAWFYDAAYIKNAAFQRALVEFAGV